MRRNLQKLKPWSPVSSFGFAAEIELREDSSYFVLLRVFRAIRGSFFCCLKNYPRIVRNTRNNMKRVELDLEIWERPILKAAPFSEAALLFLPR